MKACEYRLTSGTAVVIFRLFLSGCSRVLAWNSDSCCFFQTGEVSVIYLRSKLCCCDCGSEAFRVGGSSRCPPDPHTGYLHTFTLLSPLEGASSWLQPWERGAVKFSCPALPLRKPRPHSLIPLLIGWAASNSVFSIPSSSSSIPLSVYAASQ